MDTEQPVGSSSNFEVLASPHRPGPWSRQVIRHGRLADQEDSLNRLPRQDRQDDDGQGEQAKTSVNASPSGRNGSCSSNNSWIVILLRFTARVESKIRFGWYPELLVENPSRLIRKPHSYSDIAHLFLRQRWSVSFSNRCRHDLLRL